jgi:3-oxoadipate enol-lactonase
MPFFSRNHAQLYYEVHGPALGDAPVLVWAHGAGGSHLSWWQQIPQFGDRYTCVTFDHRGFGQSLEQAGGPGGAAFCGDLLALLDHLGIERCSLIAQSMGGWTALGFTIAHPNRVQRLVMSDTHGGLVSEAISSAWASAFKTASGLPPGVHPAAGARMAREQPALHFLYSQIHDLNPARSIAELSSLLAAAGAPTPADVAVLQLPVLFIAGDEDLVIPAAVCEVAASYFSGSKFARVPDTGHSVYFERPEKFNALIEQFLAENPL